MKSILLMAALAAGMLAPVQAGLNVKMGRALEDPLFAALISFAVGTLGLVGICVARGVEFSRISQGFSQPWPVWCAGLLGVFYVSATLILTPRLGAALTFSLVVAGQLLAALALDHFGLFGIPVQSISWIRVLGVVLITAGVVLIRRF